MPFVKELLPNPKPYYEREFSELEAKRKKWVTVRCLFHSPDNDPSLSLNLQSGRFHCFSCGARGGDVLDFHRLRYGLGFKKAAQELGAWREI